MGPLLLVQAGIQLVDVPDAALFDAVAGRRPDRAARRRGVAPRRAAGGRASCRSRSRSQARDRAPPRRDRRGARGVRRQHGPSTCVEERDLLAGRIELPRFETDFRDRPVLIVVRGVDHQRDLQGAAAVHPRHAPGARRRRRRRRRAARGRPPAGHDRRRHGLGRRGDAALRRRARRPRLRRRARARPRAPRAARAAVQARARAGHEPGRRDADRRREGRAADRLGRLALQPRRVPRQEPPGHVLDVPDAAAGRRDPRRRQGREPALPPAARASAPMLLLVLAGPARARRGRARDARRCTTSPTCSG